MAVLTYQIAYLFWTKLEHDELKTEKQGSWLFERPRPAQSGKLAD